MPAYPRSAALLALILTIDDGAAAGNAGSPAHRPLKQRRRIDGNRARLPRHTDQAAFRRFRRGPGIDARARPLRLGHAQARRRQVAAANLPRRQGAPFQRQAQRRLRQQDQRAKPLAVKAVTRAQAGAAALAEKLKRAGRRPRGRAGGPTPGRRVRELGRNGRRRLDHRSGPRRDAGLAGRISSIVPVSDTRSVGGKLCPEFDFRLRFA
jgi:hypothetical protein